MKKISIRMLVWGIMVLGITGCGSNETQENDLVKYLEEKGYSCSKGTYQVGAIFEEQAEEAVGCKKQIDDGEEGLYVIRTKPKVEVQYTFIDTNNNIRFRLRPYILYDGNEIRLFQDKQSLGASYVSSGNNFAGDNALQLPDYCTKDHSYETESIQEKYDKECSFLRDYMKDARNAIQEYRTLYQHFDLEI